jgi:putative flippase GtrA
MAVFYGSTWTFLDGNDAIELQIANVISWIGAVVFSYFANSCIKKVTK